MIEIEELALVPNTKYYIEHTPLFSSIIQPSKYIGTFVKKSIFIKVQTSHFQNVNNFENDSINNYVNPKKFTNPKNLSYKWIFYEYSLSIIQEKSKKRLYTKALSIFINQNTNTSLGDDLSIGWF